MGFEVIGAGAAGGDPSGWTWAEVDLSAIAHNVRLFRSLAPRARVMAVVKADAYGHGAVPVARSALGAGAEWLGVARVHEGKALRRAGVTAPILLLGWTGPSEVRAAVEWDLDLTVFAPDHLPPVVAASRELGKRAAVHVKVDTGMGRIGWRDLEEAARWIAAIRDLPEIEVRGVFTHFAAADADDPGHARDQWERFDRWVRDLEKQGLRPPIVHAANTAAVVRMPEAHYDLVRVGIGLYGYLPNESWYSHVPVRRALTWKSRLVYVKWVEKGATISYGCTYTAPGKRKIGTVAVGYADGFRRGLSNRGYVLVRGRRAPVVGRVCMDQTMVDLTDIPGADTGDEAVLLGDQGGDRCTADDHARWVDTISYEILCGIGKRVPRMYLQGPR